ncbi:lipoyl(octanoyl) transferase LipB [Candidatus Vondammii sp. HM_W22]|uniref:lipoyl(octanoyl) transferase LipB n=1 Tax=Candidatus Vondammii sp. HM_W22 TaxID=2687299 RepID=UPI001F1323F2|nr:lipoyl(octanoyl) transferase LipB [Candidatus Vondammii sp. HM_W22]
MNKPLIVRHLGRRNYLPVWKQMQNFTNERAPQTPDEIWLVEHHPIFTQGQAGKPEHLLDPGVIPVIQTDRGGQVTYHGPGQLVAYLMIDLHRVSLGIRQLVTLIEQSIIDLLKDYGIESSARREAPGVYVDQRKIAALGLRVRRGCSFHGLSLNVNMDLEPFSRINPCGHPGLEVTQLTDLGGRSDLEHVGEQLVRHIEAKLG